MRDNGINKLLEWLTACLELHEVKSGRIRGTQKEHPQEPPLVHEECCPPMRRMTCKEGKAALDKYSSQITELNVLQMIMQHRQCGYCYEWLKRGYYPEKDWSYRRPPGSWCTTCAATGTQPSAHSCRWPLRFSRSKELVIKPLPLSGCRGQYGSTLLPRGLRPDGRPHGGRRIWLRLVVYR